MAIAQHKAQQAAIVQHKVQQVAIVQHKAQQAAIVQHKVQQAATVQHKAQQAAIAQHKAQQAAIVQHKAQQAAIVQRKVQQAAIVQHKVHQADKAVAQVAEVQSRPGGGRGGRPPARGINQGRRRYRPANPIPKVEKPLPEKITFYESLSVAELANKLGREPSGIIKKLFMLGIMATINQELDKDAIELICADYEVEVEEEIRIDVTDLEMYFEEA